MKTFSKLTNTVTMLVAFVLMTSCGGQKDGNKDESITDLTESAIGSINGDESESVNAVTPAYLTYFKRCPSKKSKILKTDT